jgi:quinol monooxygenase YgiN
MSTILVVATLKIQDGKVDEAVAALTPVIESTHEEEGCLSYVLHQDVNDPNTLVFVERWASQDAINAHAQQPQMLKLFEIASDVAAEPPQITFCESLEIGSSPKGSFDN